MSYFDDNEDPIVYGGYPIGNASRRQRDRIARAALAAPAGSELAKARIAAHAAFDPLWQAGVFSRTSAYNWLAQKLGIRKDRCHMVLFDVEQCRKVVTVCEAHPKHRWALAQALLNDFEDLDG